MFRAWEDFYVTDNQVIETYTNKTSQQTPSGDSIIVTNSFFKNFSAYSRDGCIKISNSICNFLVEETSFIEISSSQCYATLNLYVKNSIYNKICCFKCKISTYDNCVFDFASIVSSFENKRKLQRKNK